MYSNSFLNYVSLCLYFALCCSLSNSTAINDNRRISLHFVQSDFRQRETRCHGCSIFTSPFFLRGGGSLSSSADPLKIPILATTNDTIKYAEKLNQIGGFGSVSLTSFFRRFLSIGLGVAAGVAAFKFSLYFPYLLTPEAAEAIYIPASYSYNAEKKSLFCNSAWTYATDYALVPVMFYLVNKIITSNADNNNSSTQSREESTITPRTTIIRLKYRACTLLLLCAISFTGGGVAHQFFTTIESRNMKVFRFLWTIVIGAVCAAGGVLGAFASELARLGIFSYGDEANNNSKKALLGHLVPSDLFWVGYSGLLVTTCAFGRMSYQRPAADTFVAAVSQAPPHFFLMAIVGIVGTSNSWRNTAACNAALTIKDVLACNLRLAMNSCLLPTYALVLYRTNIPARYLNASLHAWLCACYSLQCSSFRKIIKAFEK